MPCVPIACAAARRPCRCASSIAALSSSGVSCALPGTAPLVSTPPVAISLMQSAPASICSRTPLRASHGPSTARPIGQPWPPVMQSTLPATRIRGPQMRSLSTASRTSCAMPCELPKSRIVVTPAFTALARVGDGAQQPLAGSRRGDHAHQVGLAAAFNVRVRVHQSGVTHAASRSHSPVAARISATHPFSRIRSTCCLGGSSVPS